MATITNVQEFEIKSAWTCNNFNKSLFLKNNCFQRSNFQYQRGAEFFQGIANISEKIYYKLTVTKMPKEPRIPSSRYELYPECSIIISDANNDQILHKKFEFGANVGSNVEMPNNTASVYLMKGGMLKKGKYQGKSYKMNELKVCIKFSIIKLPNMGSKYSQSLPTTRQYSNFNHELTKMYFSDDDKDAKIKCSDGSFITAHHQILLSRSEYFQLAKKHMKINEANMFEFNLEMFSSAVIECMVKYCYTGVIDTSVMINEPVNLFLIADYLTSRTMLTTLSALLTYYISLPNTQIQTYYTLELFHHNDRIYPHSTDNELRNACLNHVQKIISTHPGLSSFNELCKYPTLVQALLL
jgi:hypothetical protein